MGSMGRWDKFRKALGGFLTIGTFSCGQWGERFLTKEGQERKRVLERKPYEGWIGGQN